MKAVKNIKRIKDCSYADINAYVVSEVARSYSFMRGDDVKINASSDVRCLINLILLIGHNYGNVEAEEMWNNDKRILSFRLRHTKIDVPIPDKVVPEAAKPVPEVSVPVPSADESKPKEVASPVKADVPEKESAKPIPDPLTVIEKRLTDILTEEVKAVDLLDAMKNTVPKPNDFRNRGSCHPGRPVDRNRTETLPDDSFPTTSPFLHGPGDTNFDDITSSVCKTEASVPMTENDVEAKHENNIAKATVEIKQHVHDIKETDNEKMNNKLTGVHTV